MSSITTPNIVHQLDISYRAGFRLNVMQSEDEMRWIEAGPLAKWIGVTVFRYRAKIEKFRFFKLDDARFIHASDVNDWLEALGAKPARIRELNEEMVRHFRLMDRVTLNPIRKKQASTPQKDDSGHPFVFSEERLGPDRISVVLAHGSTDVWVRVADIIAAARMHPRSEMMRLQSRHKQHAKAVELRLKKKAELGKEPPMPNDPLQRLKLRDFKLRKISAPSSPPAWFIELASLDPWIEEMRLREKQESRYRFDPLLRISELIYSHERQAVDR